MLILKLFKILKNVLFIKPFTVINRELTSM